MSDWQNAKETVPLLDEVEIAYWDGTRMCRAFGKWDYEDQTWYAGSYALESEGWVVTHWRHPRMLPVPPNSEPPHFGDDQ